MGNALPAPTGSPSPRRRWLRRCIVLLLVLVVPPVAFYFYSAWSLQSQIARAHEETDALDPRWRFEDLIADRVAIPDAENSAQQIVKSVRLFGKVAGRTPSSHKDYDMVFGELPAAAQLNEQQVDLIRASFAQGGEGIVEARKLKDMPQGRFAVTWDASGMLALLPDHQDVRNISDLLRHDGMLRAQFGDLDGAIDCCLAQANSGRALADDPFLVSLMIRLACDSLLVDNVERILAQGQASDKSLRQLQERLRAERAELTGQWVAAVRGERACFQRFFAPMIRGEKRWLELTQSLRMRVGVGDYAVHGLPTLLLKDYPAHLRIRNSLVVAAGLPMHAQMERFAALEAKVDRRDERKAMLAEVLPLLPPDLTRCCRVYLRVQSLLASAEAALACERRRLLHKDWPESLVALLDGQWLAAVPADPHDGRPLRLARNKDGLTIYSVAMDQQDQGGRMDRQRGSGPGVDVGFRLWDPGQRRQPPLPPTAIPGP